MRQRALGTRRREKKGGQPIVPAFSGGWVQTQTSFSSCIFQNSNHRSHRSSCSVKAEQDRAGKVGAGQSRKDS
ncbi:hypothetical protein R1flu_021294 [Riccia fluitans]|uniref:Uncharacterized protein n=1 Tax=Riccia fluitans TaxID=41844 RepID=A0ABD1ZQY5_9MARC